MVSRCLRENSQSEAAIDRLFVLSVMGCVQLYTPSTNGTFIQITYINTLEYHSTLIKKLEYITIKSM